MNYLNGTTIDGRVIRIEVDKGFREGRQYGRGGTGGQVCACARARGQSSLLKQRHTRTELRPRSCFVVVTSEQLFMFSLHPCIHTSSRL